jgi:uncharacterized membrane protein
LLAIAMADIDGLLNRWQKAGVLGAEAAERIRAYEKSAHEQAEDTSGGLKWQGLIALIMGAILLTCGIALFVSAHWDELGPGARFAIVIAMIAVFHFGGGLARASYKALSTTLHAVGTLAAGAAIALVGQIFNIQEHWPGAVLLWALAALAGWMLLRDEAQQTIALLLVPGWIFSELAFRMGGHIGADVYMGRASLVWAVLYLTFFIGSRRKIVQGILFAWGAIGAVFGIVIMLDGWVSWSSSQTFVPFSTRVWAWIVIAALPLAIAAFHGHKGLLPPVAAVALSVALPWCIRRSTIVDGHSTMVPQTYNVQEPTLVAHALVALFAVFLCAWGVRMASKALVNFGIVGFAIAVAWFYFSDIFDKVGRSLGLIGLGVLFLAGGWALEKMRRRLMARMDEAASEVSQ